jgi:hypothetical protein
MRLLHLDSAGVDQLVQEYEKDTKAIKDNLFRICWFMRGGISLNEAHMLSHEDQILISKIIESNLQTTKDTQMPFF